MSRDQPKTAKLGTQLRKLEDDLREGLSHDLPNTSDRRVDKLVHELRTRQIELELQNEELRRSQDELVESRDDYIDLYDVAPVGYVTVSSHGLILRNNQTFAEMLGKEKRSLLQRRLSAFIIDHDIEVYYSYQNGLLESKEKRSCELRMLRGDGEPLWVKMDGVVVESVKGGIGQIRLAITDITEQKRAEAEVRVSVRQRDHYLAVLSHELRNPMAAIVNATHLIKKKEISRETDQEAREVISRHVRHVARRLDDLLDVSRITHDKIRLHREVVDISRLTMDVVACVQSQVDEKRQQLYVETGDEPIFVEGDLGRLRQAQINLLVNASKYTSEGGTIIYKTVREGNEAVILVRDNGEGISESSIAQIFEPFTQAHQTMDRSQGGMGLGLPLVRMIVEAHGGTIRARSEGQARGSEFIIRLPLTNVPGEPRTEDEAIPVSGKKMLIVEDNPNICRMLALAMEINGLEVTVAVNGLEALEIFDDVDPEIAVIDIGLPGLNGYELARRIRKQSQFDDVLLVAVTGYGQENDRKQALAAGFDLHLVKPLDPDELLRAIAEQYAPAG